MAKKSTDASYLDLTVGPFALALSADVVLGVAQGVELGDTFEHRLGSVPLLDLRRAFGLGVEARQAPFAVTFEGLGRAAIAVDGVGHLRPESAALAVLPAFGLRKPGLFVGVLRTDDRVLLVLDPEALGHMVISR